MSESKHILLVDGTKIFVRHAGQVHELKGSRAGKTISDMDLILTMLELDKALKDPCTDTP